MEENIFEEAAALAARNKPFAVAMIAAARGSTPRNDGRMLIREDGSSLGTVGGGAMEHYVQTQAVEAIREGKSRTVRKNLVEKGENAAGMSCGGAMEVFIDVVKAAPQLILVGAGHVNLAVARNAALLGYDIAVVDNRPEFANKDRFPMARVIICEEDLVESLDQLEIGAQSRVLIATKNEDYDSLLKFIHSDSPYIGMLASKRKVAKFLSNLRESEISSQRIKALRAPVGLDIGAETPAEIAISVLAELLKFETGRGGSTLQDLSLNLVVVRGAGDIATGCAVKLFNAGFRVICLETEHPTVIRRAVSFAEAVYSGTHTVEGITAKRAESVENLYQILEEGMVPVLIDPGAECLGVLKPAILVDAILAKKNIGTALRMAPIVVALGPGFQAGKDCSAVIETARGHNLGRIIYEGKASSNTGIPGTIAGKGEERVLRAPCAGTFKTDAAIGDLVRKNQILGRVGKEEIKSPFDGLLRGILKDGLTVTAGFKLGDVDPRGRDVEYDTISDKARAVGGAVMEAIFYLRKK